MRKIVDIHASNCYAQLRGSDHFERQGNNKVVSLEKGAQAARRQDAEPLSANLIKYD